MNYNDDHLEDYDSKVGDLEKGSMAATQSSELEEGLRRGMMNAHADQNDKSARSFMDMLNNGGYSVTTGMIMADDRMVDDTFTFDGSTITSANDITFKKAQKHQQVVQFPNDTQGNSHYPPIKADLTEESKSTKSGSWSASEQSVKTICCGLGRVGVILLSVAMTAVAVALILWLFLAYMPERGQASSSSSACCRGAFEPDWSGREVCAGDMCCVVCASSIVQEGATNEVQGIGLPNDQPEPEVPKPEEEPKPQADPQTGNGETKPATSQPTTSEPTGGEEIEPSTSKPTTSEPTPAPTSAQLGEIPVETPAPTFEGSTAQETSAPSIPPSPAPTISVTSTSPSTAPSVSIPTQSPTFEHPCCQDSFWGDYHGRVRCTASGICCTACMKQDP